MHIIDILSSGFGFLFRFVWMWVHPFPVLRSADDIFLYETRVQRIKMHAQYLNSIGKTNVYFGTLNLRFNQEGQFLLLYMGFMFILLKDSCIICKRTLRFQKSIFVKQSK